MTRVVYAEVIRDELAFAEEAARHFTEHPNHYSFTRDGDFAPEALLALRWGSGDDCVLVLKLDEIHKPTIYGQMIDPDEAAKAQRGSPNVMVPREDLRRLVGRVLNATAAQEADGRPLLFSQRMAHETARRWASAVEP